MSIGAGITMIVFGLILLLGVIQIDIPLIDDFALGVLLTLAGVVSLVLVRTWGTSRSLVSYVRRRPTTRVIERRDIVERDIDDSTIL